MSLSWRPARRTSMAPIQMRSSPPAAVIAAENPPQSIPRTFEPLISAQNLMNRFCFSIVLRDTLHIQNDDGNYRHGGLRKEMLKWILESSGEGKTQFEVTRSAISKNIGSPDENQASEAPLFLATG